MLLGELPLVVAALDRHLRVVVGVEGKYGVGGERQLPPRLEVFVVGR